MDKPLRILVDGGQTGTRVRIVRPDASAPRDAKADPIHTDRPVVDQVAEAVRTTLTADERESAVGLELAAGVSGLTPDAMRPGDLLGRVRDLGVTTVALAHDSVSAFLAANRFESGTVTAVGTGVVTLGVGVGGVARVDGWGHLVGDAGSGYWIGRAGLDAALRSFDGRGPDTGLLGAARAEFGEPAELYMVLQGDPDRVSRTAGFARVVDECACAGDAVAQAINERAADELADSVRAALERSGQTGTAARVSWIGKVLTHNDRIRARFIDAVSALPGEPSAAEPHGEPLDGVSLLLDLPIDHPLAASVGRADS